MPSTFANRGRKYDVPRGMIPKLNSRVLQRVDSVRLINESAGQRLTEPIRQAQGSPRLDVLVLLAEARRCNGV